MVAKAPKLRAEADKSAIEEYQRLLRSDWTLESLEAVLALLWKLVSKSTDQAWQGILEPRLSKLASQQFDSRIVDGVRDLAEVFREPTIPPLPARFTAQRSARSLALAEKTWTYLVLQSQATVQDQSGLFRDTQSLLFLCAIHQLLPLLKKQGFEAEHHFLLNAMYVHTVLLWRDQPAHLFYLQSLIMDYLEEHERRLELLDLAFRLTSTDDHSYLTKATAVWSDLMDLGRRRDALAFLIDLKRTSPRELQDEIMEMIEETALVGNGPIAPPAPPKPEPAVLETRRRVITKPKEKA